MFHNCDNDIIISQILLNSKCYNILEAILKEVTGRCLFIKEIIDNEYLLKESFISKKLIYAYDIHKNEIIIDINITKSDDISVSKKNALILNKTYLGLLKNNLYKTTKKKELIQINFDITKAYEKEYITKKVLEPKEIGFTCSIISCPVIYNVYLENLKFISKGNLKKINKYKYLIMLVLNKNKLKKYAKEMQDEIINKYRIYLESLNNDENFKQMISLIQLYRMISYDRIYEEMLTIASRMILKDFNERDILDITHINKNDLKLLRGK